MSTTSTTTVLAYIQNWPLTRDEILLVVAVAVFIASVHMFDRLFSVTSRAYDV